MKNDIGVIVGRFQVPELTDGHKYLLDFVCKKHERVIIFLGVSTTLGTKANPLDYISRKSMLLDYNSKINVLPLSDMPNDVDWSNSLDILIRTVYPIGKIYLYGSRDSFGSHYKGINEFVELPTYINDNGTEIRKEVGIKSINTPDFRSGVIYASQNKYSNVFPTVDITVVREDKILMATKRGITGCCFIGGFIDPTDESAEEACKREFHEETGEYLEENPIYISSGLIRDWRYSQDEKIMSFLYLGTYLCGCPRPKDDILSLLWIPIANADQYKIAEHHLKLWKDLLSYLKRSQ